MRVRLPALLVCLPPVTVTLAQDNPFSAFNMDTYGEVKSIPLRSAKKMPEGNCNLKPTVAVAVLFHRTRREKSRPENRAEQTSKAGPTAALKDASAYYDKACGRVNDACATEMETLFGGDPQKLGVLTVNNMHNLERCGTFVTYMRPKNIVPPTSEPGFEPQRKNRYAFRPSNKRGAARWHFHQF
jgi:hypothetical protein